MSVTLTLATPPDLDRLEKLVDACHSQIGTRSTEEGRRAALEPLLEGTPHGAVYLIGPPKSPVGYVALSFGWSLELGGILAQVDEVFIRTGVRGRGMGTEALARLVPALSRHGVRALAIEVDAESEKLRWLYSRMGFRARDPSRVMVRTA